MTSRIVGAEPPVIDAPPAPAEQEPGLILAAARACAPAAILLAAAGAPLLSVAAAPRGQRPRTRLCYWSYAFEPMPAPEAGRLRPAELRDAERRLRQAGLEVARQLALRWPANARPGLIGLVTDGVGVAVSGDHPSALSRDWLSDHLAGRARISTLIPLGARARLALESPLTPPILQ